MKGPALLTCTGWPLRQPRGHGVSLQRRLLRREEPGVCQRGGHQGLGHQRAARVAELQRVLVGHRHRHGHGEVGSGHCGLRTEQGVKGSRRCRGRSRGDVLCLEAQSRNVLILQHSWKRGDRPGSPSPHVTAKLHPAHTSIPGEGTGAQTPPGQTGKSHWLSTQPHQSFATSWLGLIFRLCSFIKTPPMFSGWLETPRSMKAAAAPTSTKSSALPFVPPQRPSGPQGFTRLFLTRRDGKSLPQRATGGTPVAEHWGKAPFAPHSPAPGDTRIHPGTSGSCWEGVADLRDAGAALKPHPRLQVEDQLHLPASALEPDLPPLSCPSVLCHGAAQRL